MTAIIGVDGGVSGAIAVITDGNLSIASVMVWDVPTLPKKIGDKTRQVFDTQGYLDILRPYVFSRPGRAYLERGGEIPFVGADGRKQKQAGAYPYGFTNGQMFMGAAALGFDATIVEPQTWKRFFGLLGKDKEASRHKASELYPDFAYLWPNKGHHNRAEAVLIAHYGLHHGDPR